MRSNGRARRVNVADAPPCSLPNSVSGAECERPRDEGLFRRRLFLGDRKEICRAPLGDSDRRRLHGGDWAEPSYEQICSGETGHAETVEVTFDPAQISYPVLLERFWCMHNPTCRNHQGWDVGSQYRSAIFTLDDVQRRTAEASRALEATAGRHAEPIVTEICGAGRFWCAEEYHHHYLAKQRKPSCPN